VCAAELGAFGLFFWVMFLIPTIRDAVIASATGKSEEQLAREEAEKTPFERALSTHAAENSVMHLGATKHTEDPAHHHLANNPQHNVAAVANPYFMNEEVSDQLPAAEIHRLARLMMISLAGFLVAGWFLSRAYIMTLFIYGGMVQVVYQMAIDQQLVPERMKLLRVLRFSALGVIGLIAFVYILLRLQHLMPN
jgi:hypothetical protein